MRIPQERGKSEMKIVFVITAVAPALLVLHADALGDTVKLHGSAERPFHKSYGQAAGFTCASAVVTVFVKES
jgi:hypothetical protein